MSLRIRNPKEFITQLKRKNIPFRLISSTLTKTIITESNTYYFTSASGLKPSELGLIKRVKDWLYETIEFINENGELEKRKQLKSFVLKCKAKKSMIRYIDKGKLKNAVYSKEIFEIDLNKAYWNFFYKNGYTSKEIFEMGLDEKKYRKQVRLIALGALARQKMIFDYDGFEFTPAEFKNEETEKLFFKVSEQTDKIMQNLKVIAGNGYLFYWVDAIFVQGIKTRDKVIEYLNDIGIEFKTIEIKEIKSYKSYVQVLDDKHTYKQDIVKNGIKFKKGDLKPRPFIFETLKKVDLKRILDMEYEKEIVTFKVLKNRLNQNSY